MSITTHDVQLEISQLYFLPSTGAPLSSFRADEIRDEVGGTIQPRDFVMPYVFMGLERHGR